MKKTFCSILIGILLCALLTSCGSKPLNTTDTIPTPTPSEAVSPTPSPSSSPAVQSESTVSTSPEPEEVARFNTAEEYDAYRQASCAINCPYDDCCLHQQIGRLPLGTLLSLVLLETEGEEEIIRCAYRDGYMSEQQYITFTYDPTGKTGSSALQKLTVADISPEDMRFLKEKKDGEYSVTATLDVGTFVSIIPKDYSVIYQYTAGKLSLIKFIYDNQIATHIIDLRKLDLDSYTPDLLDHSYPESLQRLSNLAALFNLKNVEQAMHALFENALYKSDVMNTDPLFMMLFTKIQSMEDLPYDHGFFYYKGENQYYYYSSKLTALWEGPYDTPPSVEATSSAESFAEYADRFFKDTLTEEDLKVAASRFVFELPYVAGFDPYVLADCDKILNFPTEWGNYTVSWKGGSAFDVLFKENTFTLRYQNEFSSNSVIETVDSLSKGLLTGYEVTEYQGNPAWKTETTDGVVYYLKKEANDHTDYISFTVNSSDEITAISAYSFFECFVLSLSEDADHANAQLLAAVLDGFYQAMY